MNRYQLAALLAANPPVPSSSSRAMFHEHMQNPITSSPLSPRLEFQSRVQKLQEDPSPSKGSANTFRRGRSELEHVSSLRVTHKRSQSAQSASDERPNFWAEEREAWGQRSPKSPLSPRPPAASDIASPPLSKQPPVLSPRRSQNHPIPQPRKQLRHRASLRTFEPLHTIADVDERPKTSRGPSQLEAAAEEKDENKAQEPMEEKEEQEIGEAPRPPTSTNQGGRASKFIEGSMNERSFGIASSWFQDESTEGEKPLPPTPAAKQVTFSCTPVREPVDEELAKVHTTKKKERKGLRKSMSNFNFQTLSEKMKIFGGSSTEVSTEKLEKKKPQQSDVDIDLLNERKRKAEEAYAAQFSSKKQKLATALNIAAPSPNIGEGQGHSANVDQKPHTLRRSRRSIASSSTSPGLPRKRSRRELEQENAELRARLARQDYHSPAPQEKFVRGNVVIVSPGKKRGKLGEDVPPVPQLPARGILKVMEDSKRNSKASFIDRKSEISSGDGKKQAHIARQHWEWPDDVF